VYSAIKPILGLKLPKTEAEATMKTGTALLNGDRQEDLKRRVWDVAQKVMQRIDDGTIDEVSVGNFEDEVGVWMQAGGGLCRIYSHYWEKLVEINDGSRREIVEMIHDGLDCLYPWQFWTGEDEDAD
jgi:hypothetical protein